MSHVCVGMMGASGPCPSGSRRHAHASVGHATRVAAVFEWQGHPAAYKDIHGVMKGQADLVHVIARFDPKIVKMANAGEKPED